MTGKHHFFLIIKDLLREGRALKDYQGLSRIKPLRGYYPFPVISPISPLALREGNG